MALSQKKCRHNVRLSTIFEAARPVASKHASPLCVLCRSCDEAGASSERCSGALLCMWERGCGFVPASANATMASRHRSSDRALAHFRIWRAGQLSIIALLEKTAASLAVVLHRKWLCIDAPPESDNPNRQVSLPYEHTCCWLCPQASASRRPCSDLQARRRLPRLSMQWRAMAQKSARYSERMATLSRVKRVLLSRRLSVPSPA